MVIITTDKVYKIKKNNRLYKELDQLGGFDPYSASKVGAEIVVESYIKSFFENSNLRNRISTARAGNVIGGGDFSENRLIPDIVSAIREYLSQVDNPQIDEAAMAIANPISGDQIKMTNYKWAFSISETRNALKFKNEWPCNLFYHRISKDAHLRYLTQHHGYGM